MMTKSDPIRVSVVGGPIEMRDYDHLRLMVTHTAVLPDGSTIELAPGTMLVRHGGGVAIEQPNGLASRGAPEPAPKA